MGLPREVRLIIWELAIRGEPYRHKLSGVGVEENDDVLGYGRARPMY